MAKAADSIEGCMICRSAKVSCDASKPCCRRCVRLQKSCSYFQTPRPTPVGSFRFRDAAWSPVLILPAIPDAILAMDHVATTPVMPVAAPPGEFNTNYESFDVESDHFITSSTANDEDTEQIYWSTPESNEFLSNHTLDLHTNLDFLELDQPIPDFHTNGM